MTKELQTWHHTSLKKPLSYKAWLLLYKVQLLHLNLVLRFGRMHMWGLWESLTWQWRHKLLRKPVYGSYRWMYTWRKASLDSRCLYNRASSAFQCRPALWRSNSSYCSPSGKLQNAVPLRFDQLAWWATVLCHVRKPIVLRSHSY